MFIGTGIGSAISFAIGLAMLVIAAVGSFIFVLVCTREPLAALMFAGVVTWFYWVYCGVKRERQAAIDEVRFRQLALIEQRERERRRYEELVAARPAPLTSLD